MAKETINPKHKLSNKALDSDDETPGSGAQVTKKQKTNEVDAKKVAATKKKPVESSDDSETEVVVVPQGKGKVAAKVDNKAKAAAKKVASSDESESEPDFKAAPKKGAAPAGKVQAKPTKQVSSDDSDEEPAPPKKNGAAGKPQTKAAPKKPVAQESSSEEEVKPTTKKPVQQTKVQPKAAAKMDVESDESDESEVKPKGKATTTQAKPAAKKPVKQESSDEESDEPVKVAPKGAQKKAVKEESEEEDDEEEKAPAKKSSAPAGAKGSYECYVGNLPFNASENDLKEFFASCGEVDSVNLLKGPDGRSKGIAFVRFNDEDAQTSAVQFNGEDYSGRQIRVEKSIPKEQRAPREDFRAGQAGGAGGFTKNTERDPNSTTVFVGNLGYRTSEDTVAGFFGDCGEVKAVRIAYDQDGRSRGFAHVEFASTDSVDGAMSKAGQELDGRAVRVDFSGNKKSDGGSRGGFGGGDRRGGYGGGGRGGGFGGGRGGGRGGFRGGNEFASANKGSISNFQGQRTKL
jgi:nucleolin